MEKNLEGKINEANAKENDSKNNETKSKVAKKEQNCVPRPMPIKLNHVNNRLLFLSPTVITGLERECNKDDFYREGESCIGKGAFGEVWKVIHKATKKLFVIKIMDKHRIFENNLSDQINREIEIMYKLNHPHVMKLINHFEDNDKFYLIMPFAAKGQLYSLLRRQVRFDQRTAAQYMREVIEAVRYLHSFTPKIIHRDIKPENILLDENYRVILSDFGWSNFYNEGELRTTFCGTPEYLSPEMAKQCGHNEMVDIWALGVLLFEFLSGFAPFTGQDQDELYSNIKKVKINWPMNFPKSAKNLVSQILRLNPNERISLKEIISHAWFKANPPLRPVLTNYLTDEKEILISHLLTETRETVREKLNDLTDPNKKRKFGSLRVIPQHSQKLFKEKLGENNYKIENYKSEGIGIYYNSGVNEEYMKLKKEKNDLDKKYKELSDKLFEYEKEINKYKIENSELKKCEKVISNTTIYQMEKEIKNYKVIEKDRDKLIEENNKIKSNIEELTMENEILKNELKISKEKENRLSKKISNLQKEMKKNMNEIEDLKIINNKINFEIKDININKLSGEIKEILNDNLDKLISHFTPNIYENNIKSLENNINNYLNEKIFSFINKENINNESLIKQIKENKDNEIKLIPFPLILNQEIKKLIENQTIQEEKYNSLLEQKNILTEKINAISEERKSYSELNTEIKNELNKTQNQIEELKNKIKDIKRFIEENISDKEIKNKIKTIFNINDKENT